MSFFFDDDDDNGVVTTLEVVSDNFQIRCPHCGAVQERIYIGGRDFDPSFPCEADCGGLITLVIEAVEG